MSQTRDEIHVTPKEIFFLDAKDDIPSF